jgi:aminopeptidase N
MHALLEDIAGLDEPLLRGAAWLTVREALLEGRLRPEPVLALALEALETERDEQLVQMLVGVVTGTYWRLLAADVRRARAGAVEAALWRGLERAGTSTLKTAYLRAYRSVAVSDTALGRLEALWSGSLSMDGLTLAESDRTDLAVALALRDVPRAEAILDAEAERIDNPDRRARFDFVRPSLSADPAVREAFFESLRQVENRAREPWVLAGLANLDHPLRQAHARRFVEPALMLLEEVQRTGDIFFPGRWLDAVLDGHNHPDVARTLAGFLDAHPDYPPRLRAKILQAADGVWRAVAIVHGPEALPGRLGGT